MTTECTWNYNYAQVVVRNKKAVSAAMFLIFLMYTIAAIIAEVRKNSAVKPIYISY